MVQEGLLFSLFKFAETLGNCNSFFTFFLNETKLRKSFLEEYVSSDVNIMMLIVLICLQSQFVVSRIECNQMGTRKSSRGRQKLMMGCKLLSGHNRKELLHGIFEN